MDIFTQKSQPSHLADGNLQSMQGQWIFSPAVDITLRCPQCKAGDQHTLQHSVRVAFYQRAIHKRTRVALIGIAYQVFRLTGSITAELPLLPRWKSGASPSPQSCRLDLFEGLVRPQFECLQKPAVTIAGKIVVDVLRVDKPTVTQDTPHLPAHHRMVTELPDTFQLARRHFSQCPLCAGVVAEDVVFQNVDYLVWADISVADTRHTGFVHNH